jgi:adhesin/invasin
MSCRRPSKTLLFPVALGLVMAVALVALAACSRAAPTAPTGSTLTLSVSPTTITSPKGTATATATLRLPAGNPQPGAQVQFSTTLGSINPTLATTDNNGVGTATLSGSGRPGTAMVQAFSGAVMSTTISVIIGSLGASITLQASPATIPSSGGTSKLIAIVRDSTGVPVPGAQVNFTTTIGTLRSGGALVTTDGNGQATDSLTVRSSDITNQTTIMVGADTADSTGKIQTAMFTISILTNAASSIVISGSPTTLPASGGNVSVVALVRDAAGNLVTGAGVSFQTTIGTMKSSGSSTGNILTTGSNGEVSDTVIVPAQTAATSGMVTATAAGAGGSIITSNTLTITVNAPTGRPAGGAPHP